MPSQSSKILLVEDHRLQLEGLKSLIADHPDLKVNGEAHSVEEAIACTEHDCPDLAVVDLSLVRSRGIDFVRYLVEHHPDVKILVFSNRPAWVMADRVLAAGAHGYKEKSPHDLEIVDVIRQLLRGETYVSPSEVPKDAASYKHVTAIRGLPEREFAVFELLGDGVSPSKIAEHLGTSRSTVRTQIDRIKTKMGVNESWEVRRIALAWQLDALL